MSVKKLHDITSLGKANLQKVTSKKVNEIIDAMNSAGLNYKVYSALITQSGTDAPTAIILSNSFNGNVIWSRNNAGDYTGTLTGELIVNKTWTSTTFSTGTTVDLVGNNDANTVTLYSYIAGVASDDVLYKTPIEIRVYN
jgi:hypothetical protein